MFSSDWGLLRAAEELVGAARAGVCSGDGGHCAGGAVRVGRCHLLLRSHVPVTISRGACWRARRGSHWRCVRHEDWRGRAARAASRGPREARVRGRLRAHPGRPAVAARRLWDRRLRPACKGLLENNDTASGLLVHTLLRSRSLLILLYSLWLVNNIVIAFAVYCSLSFYSLVL